MLLDLADYQFISMDNRISITESNLDPFPSYSNPIFKQEISQIHQIRMEYSIIGLIRWAHSTPNIQSSSGQIRLIRIEYLVVGLIKWAHSDSIFNADLDRLG
jgi:hypothetical protein